jgi:hemoglobin-like flavoprotein
MMPVYFSSEELTKDDLHIARASWNLVLGDPIIGEINQHFIDNNIKERFGYPSTVAWFFDIFYKRFFDMHPSAKPLFKGGIKTQGRFMVKMITLLLSNLDDKVKFEDALVKLADVHNKRGIKAIEYGVVGEILFYTLRMVTGPVYDKTTHRAWVLVFSSMLTTLVPIAVQYEMTTESKFQGHRDFSSYTEGSITFGML